MVRIYKAEEFENLIDRHILVYQKDHGKGDDWFFECDDTEGLRAAGYTDKDILEMIDNEQIFIVCVGGQL